MSKIEFSAIYQNKDNSNLNTFIAIIENDKRRFFIIADEVDKNIELNCENIGNYLQIKKDFSFNIDICPTNPIAYKIIDITSEKEMTKTEIEKELGYPIKIKDEQNKN